MTLVTGDGQVTKAAVPGVCWKISQKRTFGRRFCDNDGSNFSQYVL